MTYTAETLTFKDGRKYTLRSAEPEDAPLMLKYMKIMLGETPFLLRSPEEFNYTAVTIEYMYAFLGSADKNNAYMIFRVSQPGYAEAALKKRGLEPLTQEMIKNI